MVYIYFLEENEGRKVRGIRYIFILMRLGENKIDGSSLSISTLLLMGMVAWGDYGKLLF